MLSQEERNQYESIVLDDRYRSDGERLYEKNKQSDGDYTGGITNDLSIAIPSNKLNVYLTENYENNYIWNKLNYDCATTSDITNSIPVEMGSAGCYDSSEIGWALNVTNLSWLTNYGGCGPIAIIGVLDYFSRYLGYNQIINNPDNKMERELLAIEVFNHTLFSIISLLDDDNTYVDPHECANAFNQVIFDHYLENYISSTCYFYLTTGRGSSRLDIVKSTIDKGMPVTLMTGLACGNGEFARHYTNVYGYESWIGVDKNGNTITRTFLKARMNHGKKDMEYYCHASILNCAQIGLITYDVNYDNSYSFNASAFSDSFVNSTGGGQYFFYEKTNYVTLPNNRIINTRRLRTSYIEDKYLVMSPNRSGAGQAYLEIDLFEKIRKLKFSISMWGSSEDALLETFTIKYKENLYDSWKTFKVINSRELSTTRELPNSVTCIFKNNIQSVRFEAIHPSPGGNRNKGRIILDNFTIFYNN